MQVQNPEATQVIRDQAKLTLAEGFPQSLSSQIIPVIDMSPDFHKNLSSFVNGSNATGNSVLYTGTSGKKLCIVSAAIAVAKDATCDLATGPIQITYVQGGVTKTLIALPNLTLTAQQMETSISLIRPIICDAGTNVACTVTYTAGNLRRQMQVYGYEEVV